jgi:hypothetical protein
LPPSESISTSAHLRFGLIPARRIACSTRAAPCSTCGVPSPDADVRGVSPVPVQMWEG